MHLTGNEKKLLILGMLFTAILFGMKFAFPWLGGITGYVVYEQKANGWNFENSGDYTYDSGLIEVADGEARLKLQATTTSTTDAINLNLGSGALGSVSITNPNPSEYETAMLEEGDEYYVEGNKEIEEIPDALEGLLWVKTKDSDKNKEINVSFDTDRALTVFVGYDKRETVPYWLSQWSYWGQGIETTVGAGTPFNIYYKNFEKGSVLLGSNNKSKSMYVILVNATVYENSREIVSQPYSYNGKISRIEWDAETPSGTSVKVRLKEAASEEEIDDALWSDYYAESGSSVNGELSSGFAQYEAFLETTDNSKTPVLRSVTLTFEEEAYPNSARIETPDMMIDKVSNWGNLVAAEELNGQSISYEYSTDSGSAWNALSGGMLSAASTASGRIRIRAEMASDGTQTPSLSSVTLNYTYISCEESWEQHYTACNASDKRVKYYSDANSCGTNGGLPEDNGTAESCNYCTPQWVNANSSCTASDTRSVNYYYTNSCCSDTGIASDCTITENATAACDYCSPSWNCSRYGECRSNGIKNCLAVTDIDSCYEKTKLSSDNYTGSLSVFDAGCSYDSEPPIISGITVLPNAVSPGDSVTITASITEGSNLTASVTLRNEKKNKVADEIMLPVNGSFRAVINTSLLAAGTYRIDVSANDTNGNKATIGDAKLFAVTEKSAVVRKLELSSVTTSINKTNPATNAIDVLIEIAGKSSSGEISVATYENATLNATKPAKEVGRYVDIVADGKLEQNITNTTLRIYYTDEQLTAANINETSLKIYFYNETAVAWERLITTANLEQNYAAAVIYHYSTYGIFGEENSQVLPQNNATNSTTNITTNVTANVTTNITTNATINVTTNGSTAYNGSEAVSGETDAQAAESSGTAESTRSPSINVSKQPSAEPIKDKENKCIYSMAVEIKETLNLAKMTVVGGKITNTGTCDIDSLELKLTGKASELIGVTPSSIGHMKAGSTASFNLTKSAQNIAPFQGLVVAEPQNGVTTYTGALHFDGMSGNVVAVTEDIELTLELNGIKGKSAGAKARILAGIALAAASAAFAILRKKRFAKL